MTSQGKMTSKEEIAKLKAELLSLEDRFARRCKKLEELHMDVLVSKNHMEYYKQKHDDQVAIYISLKEWMHAHIGFLKKATSSGQYSEFFAKYKEHTQQLEKEVLQVLKDDKWLGAEKLKTENSELLQKISDLEIQITQIQQAYSVDSYEMKIKNLEDANAELQKKIPDLEKRMAKETYDFEIEKKSFAKKFSDFSRKSCEEKKAVELKCIKLSQQVNDFEKVIILEREKFAKERKAIEQKNVGLFKEISDGRKNVENGFEEERNIFEEEIKNLTEKLSELSESALKEKKTKSEFKKNIDLLIVERDSFASKFKELEEIVSKVVVTEQTTPESQIHTPRNNSADFKKTASSSHQKPVSSKRSVKSYDQIHTTNLFYDRNIDGSGTHRRRRRYKEEEMVWKVKPVDEDKKKDEKKGKKSYVHTHQAKKKNVRKVTPIRTATNIHGPKYQWVPKPKTNSVLQALTFNGE
ncbi:hypothetical protein L6452_18996 [Arctium lappa]|uniref:Uncharacterized protein n=1 Tax=Arctium lappa TaxID=4217 RepID=A0ACB9B701_ARCLA|nr:hypothetical protein L6452_18996 [Arctium lappa]